VYPRPHRSADHGRPTTAREYRSGHQWQSCHLSFTAGGSRLQGERRLARCWPVAPQSVGRTVVDRIVARPAAAQLWAGLAWARPPAETNARRARSAAPTWWNRGSPGGVGFSPKYEAAGQSLVVDLARPASTSRTQSVHTVAGPGLPPAPSGQVAGSPHHKSVRRPGRCAHCAAFIHLNRWSDHRRPVRDAAGPSPGQHPSRTGYVRQRPPSATSTTSSKIFWTTTRGWYPAVIRFNSEATERR
jgi:hypothetical protein